ncbi:MAG: polysaccharide deacetylase family protein [bacterium]|nr:polysaccharide deacetylase family protein [bacterium]
MQTINTKLPVELTVSQLTPDKTDKIKKSVKIKSLGKAGNSGISPLEISISKVKNAGKSLSITFDGGSSDSSAPAILDILSEKQIKTTFFLTGRFIKKYPHIVKRMVSEGHEVGNHTMSHPHLTTYSRDRKSTTSVGVSYSFLKKELDETAEIFSKLTGIRMQPLWRAPFGETNKEILSWASKIGYRHIAWTVDYKAHQTMDSLDWVTDKSSSLYRSSEEIKENLLSFADKKGRAKGAIVLMHLGTERKNDIVHEKLAEIIEDFMARGYNILPVSELIKTKVEQGRG